MGSYDQQIKSWNPSTKTVTWHFRGDRETLSVCVCVSDTSVSSRPEFIVIEVRVTTETQPRTKGMSQRSSGAVEREQVAVFCSGTNMETRQQWKPFSGKLQSSLHLSSRRRRIVTLAR